MAGSPKSGMSPRDQLLDRVTGFIADRGISDLSLREIASGIGSSHRMLIHHFGSKEGLWVEVIRTVEERQRQALTELAPDPGLDPAETMRVWWQHISDSSLWANERLFFEIYGQALQGRPGTSGVLDRIVDDWLEPATEINMSLGMDRETARNKARLGIALTRGLLLDLLATGDREAVDAAMEEWISLNMVSLPEGTT